MARKLQRRRNVDGYMGEDGKFHPIRGSKGYDPSYEEFAGSGLSWGAAAAEYEEEHTPKSRRQVYYDDALDRVTLDKFVRQQGGIKPTGHAKGEINRLRNREGGSSGLVSQYGMSVHTMKEHAAEAGYVPWDMTDAEFIEEIEQAVARKRNPSWQEDLEAAQEKEKAQKRLARQAEVLEKRIEAIEEKISDTEDAKKQKSLESQAEGLRKQLETVQKYVSNPMAAKKAKKKKTVKRAAKKRAVKRAPKSVTVTVNPKRKAAKKRTVKRKAAPKRKAVKRSVKRTRKNPTASLQIGPLKLSAGATWEKGKKKNPAGFHEVTAKFKPAGTRHRVWRGIAASGGAAIASAKRSLGPDAKAYVDYRAFGGAALGNVADDLRKNPAKRKAAKKRNYSGYYKLVNTERKAKAAKRGAVDGWIYAGKFRKRGPGSLRLKRGYTLDLNTGYIWKKEKHEPNPKRKRTAKKRNTAVSQASKTAKIRKKFVGTPATKEASLNAPNGTPKDLAKLGTLVELKTDRGTTIKSKQTVWLCADRKGKLHLATSGARLVDLPKGSLGRVTRVEYSATKAHLDGKPTIYFHKFGEEDGRKPELVSDGQGGLKFKGGAYRVTAAGIQN